MKPKVGLKGKYINFVKSMMTQEYKEPTPSVEKVVDPMNKGNKYDIGYEIPEISTGRRNWSPKRPSSAESNQRRNLITITITVSLFKGDTCVTTKRVRLKYTMYLLHALHKLKMRKEK